MSFLSVLGDIGKGLIGSLFNTGSQIVGSEILNNKNFERQKELMDYQQKQQKDYQSWLYRSQYPMQVAAMKQAGLNPAQDSFQLGGVSASAPNASPTSTLVSSSDVSSVISNLQQLKNMETERKTNESLGKYYDAQRGKTFAETDMLDAQLVTFFDEFKVKYENILAQTENYKAGTQLSTKQIEKIGEEMATLKVSQDKMLSEIANNVSFMNLTNKQIKYYDSYIKSQIEELMSRAVLNYGTNQREAQKLMYELFNYSAVTSYYDNQSNLLEANQKIQDFTLKILLMWPFLHQSSQSA